MKLLVVLLPLLRIRQDFVRLLDILETLLGREVTGVGIRVVLPDQRPVRFADLILGSPSGQPEQLVEILGGLHPSTHFV